MFGTLWMQVHYEHLTFPDGYSGRFLTLRPPVPRPGVAILPVRGDEVGFVAVYRVPLRRWVWEIPRGSGECADPRHDALRELSEEFGLTGPDVLEVTDLGEVVPDSGVLDTRARLFAARIDPHAAGRPDGHETAAVLWMPAAQALEAAVSGELTESFSCLALLRAHARGLLPL